MTTINGLEQGRAWAEKRREQRRREGKMLDFEALDHLAAELNKREVPRGEVIEIVQKTGRKVGS